MSDIERAQAVVVGGGLTGLAAAVAVARAGLKTIHLAPQGPPDRRTSALMMPAVRYLQDAELIGEPSGIGHPLQQVRIIDATGRLIRAPETLFDSAEAGLPAFGWNFSNVKLNEAFATAAAALPDLETRPLTLTGLVRNDAGTLLTLSDGTEVQADLVVGADGKKSLVREEGDFRARENGFTQAALVCDLELGRPIGNCSIEFHYPQGPFTLVPAGGNRANLVWIDQRSVLDAARAAGPDALVETFREKSMRLFGSIALATPAHIFPLSTITVTEAGKNGIVLVGEAAHAFPPIGAQGLNLGLRDVADLAAGLAETDLTAPGWTQKLSLDYARRRAPDLARTTGIVDALFRSLLAEMIPAQALRAGGLWALKSLPVLRKQAFGMGMGNR
ncbi:2-octaprenyl-6-methoxyphenyl hydroxylase [Youhaiella tibetensis]|uniref:FAD-binding protein n=1 Tax=Paradevosia tibetensis TaxID=1447062 RepID=A0A5B9DPQ0_9HYPH|nr:FAD-dependent monooxygenase [Youhaiella tibetensis]QEE20528.1 FAD-binding protein [Youhaiella tibetensis]GGF23351.1 2-octaprenyl-6-methoxyphenyl hydroxylase [Youhaiella tibetensis]